MEINNKRLQYLKRLSKYYAKHGQDADDICSESIMKLIKVDEDKVNNFEAYAARTVRYTMYNYYRLCDNSRVTPTFDVYEKHKLQYIPRYEHCEPLYAAIKTLPPRQREVAEYSLKDFKLLEIQELTGYKYDTIKHNRRIAFKKLKKQLTNVY